MEKDLIIKYLAEEIRYQDCIVIPGFGGFIGCYESAYYDSLKKKYCPPYKALLFNSSLDKNDGLLASLLKDGEGISYVSALSIIENTVSIWNKDLEEGKRIEISDFGYIYKTKLGHIQFYQNKAINLYPGSYGLADVTATGAKIAKPFVDNEVPKSIVESEVKLVETTKTEKIVIGLDHEEKENESSTPVIQLVSGGNIEKEDNEIADEVAILPSVHTKFRVQKKLLVAASFVPFFFYSVWIPIKTDFLKTGKIQVSDFNPFKTPITSKYAPRTTFLTDREEEVFISVDQYLEMLPSDTKTFSYPYDEDYFIPVKLEEKESELSGHVEVKNSSIKKKEVKVSLNRSLGQYHIITGCFSDKSNALKLVKEIQAKGYAANILDFHKGLHRVSAMGFDHKSDALKVRKDMKADGIQGWILKK